MADNVSRNVSHNGYMRSAEAGTTPKMLAVSLAALRFAETGSHEEAAVAHRKLVKYHDGVCDRLSGRGLDTAAMYHGSAAAAHRTAAEWHDELAKPTGREIRVMIKRPHLPPACEGCGKDDGTHLQTCEVEAAQDLASDDA